MATRISAEEADREFALHGLRPVSPWVNVNDERECVCSRCGTTRWVRLRNLRSPGGVACRWCHGWEKWDPWGRSQRAAYGTWRPAAGADEALRRLRSEHLAPLTPVGDEFTAVGVVCVRCGETLVTIPAKINARHPGWFGCERCAQARKRALKSDAAEVFAAAGMRLLGPLTGEHVKQDVACLTCGSPRRVSYRETAAGTAPLCWTCTHGIRADEPHRVYLFRFPALGVCKVGITHDRHDRRLFDHIAGGGTLVSTIRVSDRPSALRLETWVKAAYAPWARSGIGPDDFPQGGWTETWAENGAPPLNLTEAAQAADVAVLEE